MTKKDKSLLVLGISVLIVCIAVSLPAFLRLPGLSSERKAIKEKIQMELSNGTIRDTFFLNFCFSDTLQSFNSKLNSLAKANEIRVDSGKKTIQYVFLTDSVFKNFSVMLKPVFKNNKLSELSFNFIPTTKNHLENRYTTVNQVIEKLENKYGTYSNADTTSKMAGKPVFRYYWIQGNLKIYLLGQKGDAGRPDMISIRFSDTRQHKYK